MQPLKNSLVFPLLFCLLLLDSTLLIAKPNSEKELVLVGTSDTQNSFHGRWLSLIYSEVAQRLGLKLNYQGYPASRASKLSDEGVVHGEIHRVHSYAVVHPNMVRVEESHFSVFFSAYSNREISHINSWESLRNSQYSVAYRAGIKKSKTKLNVLNIKDLTSVSDNKTGIKMLFNKRFDIYIDVQGLVDNTISINPAFSGIKKIGVIEELKTYAFVHKDYRHLIPKIASALQAMKKEGLINKYKKLSQKQ